MESDFMKARISQLHKTEAEWNEVSSFVPEAGELIVYDPDSQHKFPRLKIGDGKKSIQELNLFSDPAAHATIIDGGRITDYIK
jgi:hypothetical protein